MSASLDFLSGIENADAIAIQRVPESLSPATSISTVT
jgi:hypothetical protein